MIKHQHRGPPRSTTSWLIFGEEADLLGPDAVQADGADPEVIAVVDLMIPIATVEANRKAMLKGLLRQSLFAGTNA